MSRIDRPPHNPKSRNGNINGVRRYDNYLRDDEFKQLREQVLNADNPENDKAKSAASRSSIASIAFDKELKDSENPYILAENETKRKNRRSYLLVNVIVFFLCLTLSVFLNLFSRRIPLTPKFISIEISAFPELFMALAVNPVCGIAIALFKSIIIYFLKPLSMPNIPAKLIVDMVFILVTCEVNKKLMRSGFADKRNERRENKMKPEKDYYWSIGLLSGLIGSAAASVLSFFTVKLIVLPSLYNSFAGYGYSEASVLGSYQGAFNTLIGYLPFIKKIIPAVNSVSAGIIIYNMPLNLVKYFFCAVLSVVACEIYNDIIKKH